MLQNYTWTKHADQRLMERFLIAKSGRQSFITNFVTNGGHFVRKELDGTDIWQVNDVVIVANPESQTIITVYHTYQKTVQDTTEDPEKLPDALLVDLAEQARLLKKRAVRSSVDDIQGLVNELWELSVPLRNTHDEVVDESFEELYSKATKFRRYLGQIKAYRQGADTIIKEGVLKDEDTL